MTDSLVIGCLFIGLVNTLLILDARAESKMDRWLYGHDRERLGNVYHAVYRIWEQIDPLTFNEYRAKKAKEFEDQWKDSGA